MRWNNKISVVILMALAILVSSTGCVYVSLGPSSTPVPTVTPTPINTNYAPPATTDARPLPTIPDFVSAIAAVRPSVVAINTTVPGMDVFGGNFTQEGKGSGWIVDESGLIVTNAHVVEGANSINITLEDGRNFPADLVRADPVSDIAVVKIKAQNIKAAAVGDSSRMTVGDWVAAAGNSLGQGISATKGIVSALDVTVAVAPGQSLYGLIQTDAAINPGNSGGPLVNLLGEVIGITSVKVVEVGVEGVGYAISTKVALPIITDLIKVGYVIRPWMGVSVYSVDQLVVLRYRLAVSQGALVTQVVSGSPAANAGIQAGDVITAVGGKDINSVDELNNILHGYNIGQQVAVTYYRGTSMNTAQITLVESPPIG
jgi:serine protease Do